MPKLSLRFRGRDLIPIRAYARAQGNIPLARAIRDLVSVGLQASVGTEARLLREVAKHQQQDRETLTILLNLSIQLTTIARLFANRRDAALLKQALQVAQQAIAEVSARPEAAASVKLK